MDLDTAADQLYIVFPSDFVRRRNVLVAEAQRSGDKATATAIKQLRKPTVGAWLANLLVHKRNDQIDGLLHLGERLRDSQLNPTGPGMRQLAQQRHEVVATLVSEARGLAREEGQPVAEDAVRDLETTLSAVLAEEEAAAKFRSGRLTSALEYSGFGPLEADSRRVSPTEEHNPRTEPGKKGARQASESRLRRRLEEVEQVLGEARAAASDATHTLKKQDDELARLVRERDERCADVSALERELDKAKTAALSSEDGVRHSEEARRQAEDALSKARDRISKAEQEIGRLRNR